MTRFVYTVIADDLEQDIDDAIETDRELGVGDHVTLGERRYVVDLVENMGVAEWDGESSVVSKRLASFAARPARDAKMRRHCRLPASFATWPSAGRRARVSARTAQSFSPLCASTGLRGSWRSARRASTGRGNAVGSR